ncbi:MAG TPA: hypothetical protein PLJ52_02720 [Tenuifilaceae bacterium]|nr:hypothetical protein [Tenuifilaceae bacterium]
MITKDITIEELVDKIPESVQLLSKRGIICILCGEPVWGTLDELAKSKQFTNEQINEIVLEINKLAK